MEAFYGNKHHCCRIRVFRVDAAKRFICVFQQKIYGEKEDG
jgi:hypothetical protein